MFSKTTIVEYEVYEKVDVMEQAWERRAIQGVAMQSLPAAARRVNQWVKKRVSTKEFTSYFLSLQAAIFFPASSNRAVFFFFRLQLHNASCFTCMFHLLY